MHTKLSDQNSTDSLCLCTCHRLLLAICEAALWDTRAYPVGFDSASASDFAGIQVCFDIQVLVPVLHHRMLTVGQNKVSFFGLIVASLPADRTARPLLCATDNHSIPLVSMLTLPYHFLAAAGHEAVCSVLVFITELGSNSRSLGGKRVVLADSSVGTERTFPAC